MPTSASCTQAPASRSFPLSTNTFRNFIYCMLDVSIYFRISFGFHSKSSYRIIGFLNPFNSLCTLILYLALLADATLCCTSLHSAVSLLFAVTMQSRATMTTRTSRATTGRAWSEVSQVSHRCHRFLFTLCGFMLQSQIYFCLSGGSLDEILRHHPNPGYFPHDHPDFHLPPGVAPRPLEWYEQRE